MINCPPNASYRMTNVQRCIYFSAIIYIYICVCVCVCVKFRIAQPTETTSFTRQCTVESSTLSSTEPH